MFFSPVGLFSIIFLIFWLTSTIHCHRYFKTKEHSWPQSSRGWTRFCMERHPADSRPGNRLKVFTWVQINLVRTFKAKVANSSKEGNNISQECPGQSNRGNQGRSFLLRRLERCVKNCHLFRLPQKEENFHRTGGLDFGEKLCSGQILIYKNPNQETSIEYIQEVPYLDPIKFIFHHIFLYKNAGLGLSLIHISEPTRPY